MGSFNALSEKKIKKLATIDPSLTLEEVLDNLETARKILENDFKHYSFPYYHSEFYTTAEINAELECDRIESIIKCYKLLVEGYENLNKNRVILDEGLELSDELKEALGLLNEGIVNKKGLYEKIIKLKLKVDKYVEENKDLEVKNKEIKEEYDEVINEQNELISQSNAFEVFNERLKNI